MTHVVTLITDSSAGDLTDALVARAAAALPNAAPPVWLAPGIAADISFAPPPGTDNPRWRQAVRAALNGAPFDIVVQPLAGRRKHLLIADMDSTMIEQECIDELAEAIGLRPEIAAITERTMRGELPFEDSLRHRVALLRNLDIARATKVMERITMTPGGRTLVRTMRANGALTVLCSGGFTLFTAHVAQVLGFDRHIGNHLVIEAGRLTGALKEPILGREAKRTTLLQLCAERGHPVEASLAVGDGANDLAMLDAAGLGAAFHAKPAVAVVAQARIDRGDLTALLFLQGYSQKDFVT